MRQERIDYLHKLGAETPPQPRDEETAREQARRRIERGAAPHDFQQGEPVRYRLRYHKLGPMAMQGHLDMVRVLPRVFRRAALPLFYSQGYSPKPKLSFGPALALGIGSVAEYVDVALTQDLPAEEVVTRLQAHAEPGLTFSGMIKLGPQQPALAKMIDTLGYLVALPGLDEATAAECAEHALAAETLPVEITRKGKTRTVDLRPQLVAVGPTDDPPLAARCGLPGGRPIFRFELREAEGATPRPAEVVQAIFGVEVAPVDLLRVACGKLDESGALREPLGEASFSQSKIEPAGTIV
jgi:radical SAM-linked protein